MVFTYVPLIYGQQTLAMNRGQHDVELKIGMRIHVEVNQHFSGPPLLE